MSSNSEGNKNSRKPPLAAFKQQQLKAWQPILTPLPVITAFLVVGIAFIPVGSILLSSSNAVEEVIQRYDNKCDLYATNCTISITVPANMDDQSVYMYYRLENYYQNHRRYVKSRNDAQLRGDVVNSYRDLEDCDPRKSLDDSKDPKNFYLPCGLIAWSMFNDTFVLRNSGGTIIPLQKDGIAWSSDVKEKFNNPPADAPGIRVIANFEDEDFVVWMRTAGLPSFKKLYRVIPGGLKEGTYFVDIENNYPVAEFSGKKYLVLSTTSWTGGKNPFLGWAYIVVGCVCFLQGVVFGLKHKLSPRAPGDVNYLDWNK